MGVLVVLTVIGRHTSGDGRLLGLDISVGILACVALPLLMRRPVAGALVLAALAVLSPAATPPATFGTLRVAQERSLTMAIGVGVAGAAAHAAQGLLWSPPGLDYGWWLLLAVVAHAALVA